jgi:hypothetical protein
MQNSKKQIPQQRVDDGLYTVKLKDLRFTKNDMGTRVHWVFEFTDLPLVDGNLPTLIRTTSPSIGSTSKRREIIEALDPSLKEMLESTPFAQVSGQSLIGKTCKAHVNNKPNKAGVVFSNMEMFFPCYDAAAEDLGKLKTAATEKVADKDSTAANDPEE